MTHPRKDDYDTGNPEIDEKLRNILSEWGVTMDQGRFFEMLVTVLKFAEDHPTRADIKQFNQTMKELRYANKVFQPYLGTRRLSIFGSARTSPSAPEYQYALEFARRMRDIGYMIITGGGPGVMAAAQAGAGRERSFALNINLPFEQAANETILGDRKCINFKYFFNRKVNFIKHAHAMVAFPGGFGTMDEVFETLTLIQTGKSSLVPVVLIDHPDRGEYWNGLYTFLQKEMLENGLISPEDFSLFKITTNLDEAQHEILHFYHNFHSYRYIKEICVIRVQRELPDSALNELTHEFQDLLPEGDVIHQGQAFPEEINEPEYGSLPRVWFVFHHKKFGRLRQLIDQINEF